MQEWTQITEGIELAGSFEIHGRAFTMVVFPDGRSFAIERS